MAGFNDPVLPPEIWREILARASVKSVIRCRSVCKSWYSLISCPNFISHHITNLPDKDGNRFLLQLEGEVFSCHDESCMESREHDHDCPDQFIGVELEVISSCNGLFCLARYDDHDFKEDFTTLTFLIWNPAIGKVVELPPIYCLDDKHVSLIGFGFDSNTSDYKVMCCFRGNEGTGYDEREIIDSRDECEIIDLRNRVWRSVTVPRWFVRHPEAECYVNGAVHWSSYRHGKSKGRFILSFNASDESFREIRMPDSAEFIQSGDYNHIQTQCVAFGGLVHVIVWKTKMKDGCNHRTVVDVSKSCSVWAMKKYGVTESWIKVSNIDLKCAQVTPITRFFPAHFILWAKHEILMMCDEQMEDQGIPYYKGDLVLYDTGTRKSRHIFSITKAVRGMRQFKESLALLLM